MAACPVPSETPSGKLYEMEVDTEVPVWATPMGVVAPRKWLNAEKGTTVSLETLTAEPVEVLPRPPLARELVARLRAMSLATALAVLVEPEAALNTVVPATACVACVPLTAPPEVLTYSSFSTSGCIMN